MSFSVEVRVRACSVREGVYLQKKRPAPEGQDALFFCGGKPGNQTRFTTSCLGVLAFGLAGLRAAGAFSVVCFLQFLAGLRHHILQFKLSGISAGIAGRGF